MGTTTAFLSRCSHNSGRLGRFFPVGNIPAQTASPSSLAAPSPASDAPHVPGSPMLAQISSNPSHLLLFSGWTLDGWDKQGRGDRDQTRLPLGQNQLDWLQLP